MLQGEEAEPGGADDGYLGDEKVGTELVARVLRANEDARELPITLGKRP